MTTDILGNRQAGAAVAERADLDDQLKELRAKISAITAKRSVLDEAIQRWLRTQLTDKEPTRRIVHQGMAFLVKLIGKQKPLSYRDVAIHHAGADAIAALKQSQPWITSLGVERLRA